MNVNYAKFQKKFDSRKISRELPYQALLMPSAVIWRKDDSEGEKLDDVEEKRKKKKTK